MRDTNDASPVTAAAENVLTPWSDKQFDPRRLSADFRRPSADEALLLPEGQLALLRKVTFSDRDLVRVEPRQRNRPGEAGALVRCPMQEPPNDTVTLARRGAHAGGPAAIFLLPDPTFDETFDLEPNFPQ